VEGIIAAPTYLQVRLPARATFQQPLAADHTCFAYLYEGTAAFGEAQEAGSSAIEAQAPVILESGEYVQVEAGDGEEARFLLASG
jgi:redox-sensitive bicupin YhaK (pirin superfamily)